MKEKEELTNPKFVLETKELILNLEKHLLNQEQYKHPPDLQEAIECAVRHFSAFLSYPLLVIFFSSKLVYRGLRDSEDQSRMIHQTGL